MQDKLSEDEIICYSLIQSNSLLLKSWFHTVLFLFYFHHAFTPLLVGPFFEIIQLI